MKRLLGDPGIVRNRLKLAATIQSAKAFLAVQKEFGSLDAYVWKFVGSTICYALTQATGMVNDRLVTCPQYTKLHGKRWIGRSAGDAKN